MSPARSSRSKKRSKSSRRKVSPPYWTLLLWPVALAAAIGYESWRLGEQKIQQRQQEQAQAEQEIEQLEQSYTRQMAELEIQVGMLEKQLEALRNQEDEGTGHE